jgi:hypothetical protein
MATTEVIAVAAAIAAYLQSHPNAGDTAEGIQRWWLGPSFRRTSQRVIQEALGKLEQEGVIRKTLESRPPVYRRRR